MTPPQSQSEHHKCETWVRLKGKYRVCQQPHQLINCKQLIYRVSDADLKSAFIDKAYERGGQESETNEKGPGTQRLHNLGSSREIGQEDRTIVTVSNSTRNVLPVKEVTLLAQEKDKEDSCTNIIMSAESYDEGAVKVEVKLTKNKKTGVVG